MLTSGSEARVVGRGEGHVDLVVELRLARSLIGFTLASAGAVEILAPAELRAEARASAQAALAVL